MVGIFQFFDFSQASSSRKLLALAKHNNGFEPPRNSLEFSMEAYQSFQVVHEDIPYSHNYSSKEDICKHQSHMKKLIHDTRLDKTKDRDSRPSVVARLMGMDALPSDIKPATHAKELKDEKRPRKEPTCISSNQQALFILKPMKHLNNGLFPYHNEEDFDQQTRLFEMDKPQPREHPQEELLQKFKKEFEAWQASRMWERSASLELGNDLPSKGYINTFPQDNLCKEKLSRYVDQKRNPANMKTTELEHQVSSVRPHRYQEREDHFKYDAIVSKLGEDVPRNDTFGDNRRNIFSTPKSDRGRNVSTSPGRIVILKPGYEMNENADVSFLSSPVMLDKQRNMKCFLEQVNERLIKEIQGKPRIETTTRCPETEAFVSERLADSKQIALKKAAQIREVVSKGNNIAVLHSKSTKSHRNEVQPCGVSSPGLEFLNRNTRKSLSERMKNVLRDETDIRFPSISRGRTNTSTQHFAKKGRKKSSCWEDKKVLNESKSFRHDSRREFDDEGDSPRNLLRSYSAPTSGTEFGKLLLEDKDALTAVHIHRKHEAPENNIMEARKMKKDGFSIKSRVSSLRQNLTLKGKLFGKRIQLMDESAEDELPLFMNATETSPSVVMNLSFAQDNSTEVPPSPASVCSSSHDEMCRPYYPSPVSPLDAQFHEDHPSLPPSEELNSNLLESNLSEELNYNRSEESTREIKPAEAEDVESNAKTYVRDILITSGLFERNHFDQALWEWDTPRKPVSMLVFEEVEETYRNNGKLESTTFHLSNAQTDQVSPRILFDLLNEALQRVVQSSKLGCSPFRKWFPGPRRLPHGNELLETVWKMIQLHINLPGDQTTCPIEGMVAQELKTPWTGMLHEDIDAVCVDIESLIVEDLLDEFVFNNLSF